MIETQFEKQNTSLERSLRNQVHQSVNKHMGSIRSNNGSFTAANADAQSYNTFAGHRQGQMLDRLKTIKNLAMDDPISQQ